MKNPPLVGLVATGSMARSWFLTVAEQADRLGPVISSNFRVASRFVNTLQAGVPAEDYGLLDPCRLILVKVGEDEWFEVLDGLARARIRWKGKSVILCDTDLESSEWCTLEKLGASVATMLYTEINEQSCYVMEGDPRAVSDAQSILNLPRVRVIELARSHKALYLACRGSGGGDDRSAGRRSGGRSAPGRCKGRHGCLDGRALVPGRIEGV